MNRPESNGWPVATRVQWEYERILGNLSIGNVILIVAAPMIPFVALCWISEAWLGIKWPQSILATFVAIHLLPGYPTDLADKLPMALRTRLNFWIPVWCARIALVIVILHTYSHFMEIVGVSKWVFLTAILIIATPVIWLALMNIRQYAMSSMLGLIPPSYLPAVIVVGVSQVVVLAVAVKAWFGESSSVAAAGFSMLAVSWHLIGNVVLVHLIWRRKGCTNPN